MTVKNLSNADSDGSSYGQSASDKISFHGVTPVVQAAATTAPAATAATSSTPFGYAQAQADAIVTWIRAADVALKAKGIIASA